MATEGLQIRVGADVGAAVQGLKQVEAQSLKTGAALDKGLSKSVGGANQTLVNFGRVVQDAPFGLIGIANNIDPLIESFRRLRASSTSAGAAFQALGSALLGPAGIAIAVSSVTSAFIAFGPQIKAALFGVKQLTAAQKEAAEAASNSVRQLSKQREEFLALVNVAKELTNTEQQRSAALEQLNKIIPDSIGQLTKLNIVTDAGEKIIRAYIKALEARATAELLVNRIAENNVKLFDNRNKALSETARLNAEIAAAEARQRRFETAGRFEIAAEVQKEINNLIKERNALQAGLRSDSNALLLDNQNIRKEYERQLALSSELKTKTSAVAKSEAERKDAVLLTSAAILRDTKELEKQRKILSELNSIIELQRQQERTTGGGATTADLSLIREQGGGRSPLEQLQDLAGEFNAVNENARLLQDTLNNGINAGIDQFFNAIANNQDPFKALIQSAQRLVVELAAAVVKALILKAVTTAAGAPGADRLIPAFGSGLRGGGIVRGDLLQLAVFGR